MIQLDFRPSDSGSSRRPDWQEPGVPPFLRWAHAIFAFSIAFETMGVEWLGKYYTPARLCGYGFCLLTVFYPATCFRKFPKAFLGFGAYLVLFVTLGLVTDEGHQRELFLLVGVLSMCMIQSLAGFNLMCNGEVATWSIRAFVAGYGLLVVLQLIGASTTPLIEESGRISSWGLDPNWLAVAFSVALIALVGLLRARLLGSGLVRLGGWALAILFLIGIVQSGSRGGSLALFGGALVFLLSGRNMAARFMGAILSLFLIGGYVWLISVTPSARERWENTVESGDTSGRVDLYSVAGRMFIQKPWLGWGPVEHRHEIGRRLRLEPVEAHNTLLTVVNETGVVGAVPFLYGCCCCLVAAWRARSGRFGITPLAILVTILTACLSLSANFERVLWFVFAFALARGDSMSTGQRSWFQRLLTRWTVWRQLHASQP